MYENDAKQHEKQTLRQPHRLTSTYLWRVTLHILFNLTRERHHDCAIGTREENSGYFERNYL